MASASLIALDNIARENGISDKDAEVMAQHWFRRGVDALTAKQEARQLVRELKEARGG